MSHLRLPRFPAAAALLLGLLAALGAAQSRNPKDLAVGKLLVASASMTGPFQHAVILLVGYEADKGAAGIVLNHPAEKTLAQLFPHLPSASGRTDTAFWGGPVTPSQLSCLLNLSNRLREAHRILPGIDFSTSQDLMQLALNAQQTAAVFRVYQGYTGWQRGQLAKELKAGAWTIHTASAATVFAADPAGVWQALTTAQSPGTKH